MNDVGTFMIYLQPSTHGNSENIKHPTLACHLKKHLEGEKRRSRIQGDVLLTLYKGNE